MAYIKHTTKRRKQQHKLMNLEFYFFRFFQPYYLLVHKYGPIVLSEVVGAAVVLPLAAGNASCPLSLSAPGRVWGCSCTSAWCLHLWPGERQAGGCSTGISDTLFFLHIRVAFYWLRGILWQGYFACWGQDLLHLLSGLSHLQLLLETWFSAGHVFRKWLLLQCLTTGI